MYIIYLTRALNAGVSCALVLMELYFGGVGMRSIFELLTQKEVPKGECGSNILNQRKFCFLEFEKKNFFIVLGQKGDYVT
jgi:hypothetical protein